MLPLTVLVVEDYPAGMLVSTLMLEHLGYAVEGVASGSEAIEKVRNSDVPFTAILMDVNLGDIDGFEATRAIRIIEREKGFSNTIIALTAHVLAGDHERCLKAGMDDYMSKPLNPTELKKKLEHVVEFNTMP